MTKLLKSAPAQGLLAWLLAGYIRLAMTLQLGYRIEGGENLRALTGAAPMIAAFWHETLPTMPVLWREAKRAGMARPAVGLASRHRDGQLIGGIIRRLGLGLVSGSSSRGGVAGMQELLRALQAGSHVVLTPDGPRGPARRPAAGVAALAGLSGARILPCGVASSRYITLHKSWDKMRVPLPFGRLVLVCGSPLPVSRENWRDSLPAIEAALNAAQLRAQRAVRGAR